MPEAPRVHLPKQAARAECHQCQGDAHRVIWVTWGVVSVTPHEVWSQKDSTAESWSLGDPALGRGAGHSVGQGHHGLPGVGPRTAVRRRSSASLVRSPRAHA